MRSRLVADTRERAVVAAARSERPAAASGAQMHMSLWRHNGHRSESDTRFSRLSGAIQSHRPNRRRSRVQGFSEHILKLSAVSVR
jgi:hypothetical protein